MALYLSQNNLMDNEGIFETLEDNVHLETDAFGMYLLKIELNKMNIYSCLSESPVKIYIHKNAVFIPVLYYMRWK